MKLKDWFESMKNITSVRVFLAIVAVVIVGCVGYVASGRSLKISQTNPTPKRMDVQATCNGLMARETALIDGSIPHQVAVYFDPINNAMSQNLDNGHLFWQDQDGTEAKIGFYYHLNGSGLQVIDGFLVNQDFAYLVNVGFTPLSVLRFADDGPVRIVRGGREIDGRNTWLADFYANSPNDQEFVVSNSAFDIIFNPKDAQGAIQKLVDLMESMMSFDITSSLAKNSNNERLLSMYSPDELESLRSYWAATMVLRQAFHHDQKIISPKTQWIRAYDSFIWEQHDDYLASIWPNLVANAGLVAWLLVALGLTWIAIALDKWTIVVVDDYHQRQSEERAASLEKWFQSETKELWSQLDEQLQSDSSLRRCYERALDTAELETARRTAIGELQMAHSRQLRLAARKTPIPTCVGVDTPTPKGDKGESKREALLKRLAGIGVPEDLVTRIADWSMTRLSNLERLVGYVDSQFGSWALPTIYSDSRLSGMLDNPHPLMIAMRSDDSELVATLLKLSDQAEEELLASDGEAILNALSGRSLVMIGSAASVGSFSKLRSILQELGAVDEFCLTGAINQVEIDRYAKQVTVFILVRAAGVQTLAEEIREAGAQVVIVNRFNLDRLCQGLSRALAA